MKLTEAMLDELEAPDEKWKLVIDEARRSLKLHPKTPGRENKEGELTHYHEIEFSVRMLVPWYRYDSRDIEDEDRHAFFVLEENTCVENYIDQLVEEQRDGYCVHCAHGAAKIIRKVELTETDFIDRFVTKREDEE